MDSRQRNTHPVSGKRSALTHKQRRNPPPNPPQKRPLRKKTTKGPAKDGECQFTGEDYPSWLGFDPQKPGSGFKQPFPPIDGDPWEEAMHMIQKEDDAVCDAWNAEIQNLLIFSGLFSAVITAFAVETLNLLQPDSEVATILLLAELSNHFLPNATTSLAIAEPFRNTTPPESQSLRLNCFIVTSLILSLGTALVGIIVLQWIRSYRKPESSYDREGISLREARHMAFNRWGVPSIIAYLPVCLGISFIVFLIGLVDFLFTLNTVLAIIIAAFVGVIVLFLLITTFLPVLQIIFRTHPIPLCAYQSAQSMLCCRLFSKFNSIREWTELISEVHKEKSDENNRDRWLQDSLAAIFRRFNSAQSFRLAYHCFQSIPKNVSKNVKLRWEIVSQVLRDSKELLEVGEDILDSMESSFSSVACTEFLSLLLLLWNKRLDPQYAGHRSELYFRCIQTFSHLNGESTKSPTYMALINLWWSRSDADLSLADSSKQSSSYLATFLTALQANPSFEGEKRPLAFVLFWKLLAARIHEGSRESLIVVQDCLRVLTSWLLTVQNLPENEYKELEDKQVLRSCLQAMFDYNVFSNDPMMTKLIDQEPSVFLQFLDIFLDPKNKRLGHEWRSAIEGGLADTWDEFLAEANLDSKYLVLASKVDRLAPSRLSATSSAHSNIYGSLTYGSRSMDPRSLSPEPQSRAENSYCENVGLLEDNQLRDVVIQTPSTPVTLQPMPDPTPYSSTDPDGYMLRPQASASAGGSRTELHPLLPLDSFDNKNPGMTSRHLSRKDN